MKIVTALQTIITSQNNDAVSYAVKYAARALVVDVKSEEFRTLLLYIKPHIAHWRGGVAKQVRQSIASELSR